MLNMMPIQIGKISLSPQDILGEGSNRTMVFKGTYQKTPAAIKRISMENSFLALSEVEALREITDHKNIVRYFKNEKDEQYIYIAL